MVGSLAAEPAVQLLQPWCVVRLYGPDAHDASILEGELPLELAGVVLGERHQVVILVDLERQSRLGPACTAGAAAPRFRTFTSAESGEKTVKWLAFRHGTDVAYEDH